MSDHPHTDDELAAIAASTMRKRCTKCDTWKPLDQFHRQKTGADGRCSHCKVCRNTAAKERAKAKRAIQPPEAEPVHLSNFVDEEDFVELVDSFKRPAGLDLAWKPWTVIVIPDAHFDGSEDWVQYPHGESERAVWLGQQIQLAIEAAPRQNRIALVNIGDWALADSLNYYDKGTGSAWNKTFLLDLEASDRAFLSMWERIKPESRKRIERMEYTLGNHEERANTEASKNPHLKGTVYARAFGDLWESLGFTVHDFLKPVEIGGVYFAHYIQNRGSNKAVSSVNMARQLILKAMRSVVVGHTHEFKYDHIPRVGGGFLCACSVGCAFNQGPDSWMKQDVNRHDPGLVVLTIHKPEEFFPTFISMPEDLDAPK